jgi:two-component sensor histidine kinase
VATIVNELAANAAKHSFMRLAGAISLRGERVGETGYRLVCGDDGGEAADERSNASERVGLGLKILQASVRQLGGKMVAGRGPDGYSTTIDLNFTGS